MYCGEWSSKTHEPHGRGVFVRNDGKIFVKHFKNGSTKVSGKMLAIDIPQKGFVVGHV